MLLIYMLFKELERPILNEVLIIPFRVLKILRKLWNNWKENFKLYKCKYEG